jgi:hypothetical protein
MTDFTKALATLFVKSNKISKKSSAPSLESQDFEWITQHSGIPWLKLSVQIPYEDILREIKNNVEFLVEHRDDYGEHEGWKSFCIHGKTLHTTQHCTDDRPFVWIPEVVEQMPVTVNYFKSWNLDFNRLRVMALEPGGFISVHRDEKTPFLGPINIALTQPVGCDFVMEGWGAVPFTAGDAFMLDISNLHAVVNNSNETRYHIIAHYNNSQSTEFRKMVEESYHQQCSSAPGGQLYP